MSDGPDRPLPPKLINSQSHPASLALKKQFADVNLPRSAYVLKAMFLQNPPSGGTNTVTIGSTTVVVRRKGDTHALDNLCDLAGHVAVGLQLSRSGKSDSPSAGSRPDYAGRQSDFGAQHSGLTALSGS